MMKAAGMATRLKYVCLPLARPVSPRRRRHSAINGENGEYLNTNGGSAHPEGPWDKRRNPQQEVCYLPFSHGMVSLIKDAH